MLEEYLAEAGICLLAVSHDRFFIDKISDHIFVFEGNGAIRDFPGNYTQYRSWLNDQPKQRFEGQPETSNQNRAAGELTTEGSKPATSNQPPAAKPKLTFNEKRELESLEKSIETLEAEKTAIENELSGGKLTAEELMEYSRKHGEVTAALEAKTDRWLELSEKS